MIIEWYEIYGDDDCDMVVLIYFVLSVDGIFEIE